MKKKDPSNYLEEVAYIVRDLEALNLKPVLVGGMALVILGSQRVTQDFDFVISHPHSHLLEVVSIFYNHGMELVAKLDKVGQVLTTIDNKKVAELRIRMDEPSSVYFYNEKTGLRIDLLFDFPLAAAVLKEQATSVKIKSQTIPVASKNDLLRLKKIAKAERNKPGDEEDLAFLQSC